MKKGRVKKRKRTTWLFKSGGAVLRPAGGGAGSLSGLWSAAKMAAGIIMIIVQPSMNRTIVIVGKDATMTWLTVPILTSYKLHEQAYH